jgi:hypothetical protein
MHERLQLGANVRADEDAAVLAVIGCSAAATAQSLPDGRKKNMYFYKYICLAFLVGEQELVMEKFNKHISMGVFFSVIWQPVGAIKYRAILCPCVRIRSHGEPTEYIRFFFLFILFSLSPGARKLPFQFSGADIPLRTSSNQPGQGGEMS